MEEKPMEKVSYYAIIPANVRYDPDLPANAKLLYGEITSLCNEKGYCWASNNYFAKLYNVKKNAVSEWISKLVKKGYITSEIKYVGDSKIVEERRLRIAESIMAPEIPITEKSDTLSRKNGIGYPEKTCYPITEKREENNTVNNKVNNKNNIYSDFEKLWSLYPNKKGKSAALKSYEKAIKKGTTNDVIEKGIRALIAECKKNNTETRFIPHGSTWFNQERWNDCYDGPVMAEDYEGGENILDELGDLQ